MVRANEELAPPTVKLSDALKAEGLWIGETSYPQQAEQTNSEPIDIRGDAEPTKTGAKAKGSRKSPRSK